MLPYPFDDLLRRLFHASEDVDNFDLDSTSPESRKQWDRLLDKYAKAERALCEHVLTFYRPDEEGK